MSNLHQDRLFYGDIEECYYHDKKTGESKSKIIKRNALLYNSGDYYIDLDQINFFDAFKILFNTAPEESLFRMPQFPQFIYKHFLCAWGGKVQGYWIGHKFVREESLKEALKAFKGTIILVSHEPEFYSDIVTDILNAEEWTTKIL